MTYAQLNGVPFLSLLLHFETQEYNTRGNEP